MESESLKVVMSLNMAAVVAVQEPARPSQGHSSVFHQLMDHSS